MKSIHDYISEFESEVAALFAKLREAIAAHPSLAPAASSAPADLPADFGPVPPDGSAAPPSKPADPPAPPAPQPDTPRPVNDYDPTAPGFVMPVNPPPAQAPAPAPSDPNAWPGPAVPVSGAVPMSWAMFPLYLSGNTSITLTPDAGWKGAIRLVFGPRPGTVYPYTTTVNGGASKTAETDGIIDYWVRVGGPAQNPQEIVIDGAITAAVTEAGAVTCAFYVYPE